MDPAITMWYFRWRTKQPELERPFWEGFGESAADHGLSAGEFETLVAARTLLLVNHFVGTDNAILRTRMVPFVRRCESVLAAYLRSGRFAPWEVPG
jgi:hypothetical protein